MVKASIDKKLISIIILLLVFANSGSIFSLFSPTEILDQKIDEFPYIDHGCQSSKYEVQRKVNNLNNLFDSKITYSFYEIPTASWFCQDRPVVSNGNSLIIENKSEINVSIGVGVFKAIDNFEKIGYFLLIYIFILLINSKFKILKIEKVRNFNVNIPSLLFLTIFFGVCPL